MSLQYTEEQLFVLEKHLMNCADVEGLYGEYVENALPATLKQRVDEHVAECVECQHFCAEYLRGIELARQLADRPVPVAVRERLREALNRRLGLHLSSTSIR